MKTTKRVDIFEDVVTRVVEQLFAQATSEGESVTELDSAWCANGLLYASCKIGVDIDVDMWGAYTNLGWKQYHRAVEEWEERLLKRSYLSLTNDSIHIKHYAFDVLDFYPGRDIEYRIFGDLVDHHYKA